MQLGLKRPLSKKESSPRGRLHGGRLTALTVLLAGTCLGTLGYNGAEEQRRLGISQQAQISTASVRAADRISPLAPFSFSRADNPTSTIRPSLDAVRLDGGAAYVLDEGGRNFVGAGEVVAFALTHHQFKALAGNKGYQTLTSPYGQPLVAVSRALPGGQTFVSVVPAPKGAWRVWIPYLAAGIAIFTLAGSFLAMAAQFRTLQARTEGERNALFTRALGPERAGCGLWKADQHHVTLPAALRAALGFGREDAEMTYASLRAAVHPDDLPHALGLFLGNGKSDDGQIRMRNSAREWQHIYMRVTKATSPREGVILPVTETGLDDGRANGLIDRLRETLEAIPEAFLLWDSCGRLVAWNEAFTEIFQIKEDVIREGFTARELAKAVGIDGSFLYDYFAPPGDGAAEIEALFPEDRFLKVTRRRTIGDGWVCIGQDITDARAEAEQRARNERELQMTVDILERSRRDLRDAMQSYEVEKQRSEDANRAKSEFLANMSHELRTPLNAINGFSELMREELYGPLGHEKYAEYITDIHESGKHLLALIDDILDLSKIEAGKMDLDPSQVDLERVLSEGLRFIEPQMHSSSVTLKAIVENVPSVWGDPRAIKQVLINLLSNAEKFTPQGGSVTVTTLVDLSSVTVMIADTGIGMNAEQLDRLGTPFELVEDHFARTRQGTGLGLALSKSLMGAQGGILSIASEMSRGTVASFTLPRRPGVVVTLPSLLIGRSHVLTEPAMVKAKVENELVQAKAAGVLLN